MEVEPVEVLPPDFAEVGLQAQLGVTPGATTEEVKVVYKKMELKLHADKNKNNEEKALQLFKRLNSPYENWRSSGTPAGQGGNNQRTPQPHYTNFQLNPTYFRSNFCGQNESHRETPQHAQQQSENRIEGAKGQNTRGARGRGEQQKIDGRSRSQ